jgi:site-specific DNA-methyltransferase (adenine-specific)
MGDEARFFYCPKPSQSEKEEGLEDLHTTNVNDGRQTEIDNPYQRGETQRRNIHPTVKSIALMDYMIKLITPPGAKVLDPFMGSGTTGVASVKGGWEFVGIEKYPPFFDIAQKRIEHAKNNRQVSLFDIPQSPKLG